MKKLLFLLLCAPIIVLGQQTINGTILHDNLNREYILYVPASYDASTAVPLVFCFHGYGSAAVLNMAYTNFTGIADTAGFILIHPQGTIDNTGKAHWNVGGWTLGSTVDDVGFTSTLLDSIVNTYNIDTARVYSTGMSNGGYMSFLLACQLSDRIAAIASITGSMTPQTYNACNPQHPTPIMQMHGTADGTVPYAGAPSWTKSIDEVLQYWVAYNNCDTSPSTTAIPDIDMSDNSTVEHVIYSGGDNGTTTEHFKVFGGGHDWPGVTGNMDINASAEIWKFFYKYQVSDPGADSAFCDSIIIDCCSFGTSPALSFEVTNNSSYTFSYPGFILFNNNGDTVAVDDGSNVFTIMPGQQTRYLNATVTIPLPFSGYLNLYDGYFSGPSPDLLCTYQVNIQDTTVSSIPPGQGTQEKAVLEMVYDIYGRKLKTPLPKHTLLFYQYSNGKVEKRMTLE